MDTKKEFTEQEWEDAFSQYGLKFSGARPEYQMLSEGEQLRGVLYWLELEMYNGGFLQFFCNWGFDAYLLARKALEQIGAEKTKTLLDREYKVLAHFQNDERLSSYEDIYTYLTDEEETELNELDEAYWEDEEEIMQRMCAQMMEHVREV